MPARRCSNGRRRSRWCRPIWRRCMPRRDAAQTATGNQGGAGQSGGGACRRDADQTAAGHEGGAGQSGGGACRRGADQTAAGHEGGAGQFGGGACRRDADQSIPSSAGYRRRTQIPTVQSVAIEACRNQHGGNPGSPGPNSEAKDRTIVIAGECRQRRVDKRAGYAKLEEPAQGCSAVRPAQHQSEGRQEVSRTDGGRETQVHHGKGHRG